jgi:hypothetical protein
VAKKPGLFLRVYRSVWMVFNRKKEAVDPFGRGKG